MTTLVIGTSRNYTWSLIYTLTQSVEDNTSSIAWTLRGHRNVSAAYGAYQLTGSMTFSAIIDGQIKGDAVSSFDFRDAADIDFASDTTVITHNADGTHAPVGVAMRYRGVAVSNGFDGNTGAIDVGTPTIDLPTIPRATVPTLTNSSRQIGQSTTINLPRASDSFTHDITYTFGSLTGQTSGLSASTGVATSATFTVPQALVSEMVGQSSAVLTFTVVTKSGATVIGTKTVQLTVTPANGTVYQRPVVAATVQRALSDGTVDDDGVCAKVSITATVTSVLISTEQNTLTWETEVSADNGSTWQQLGTGTVSSHGLTLNAATTYTDSDPGTGGTQSFATTAGFLFRITITDAYSATAVQVVPMSTALALFDFYDGAGDSSATGIAVGALFNPSLESRIQVGGENALPVTRTVSYTTSSLADGASETATLDLGIGFTILHFVSSFAARFRAYQSVAHRSADSSRAVGVFPSGDHGLIFEDDGAAVSDYATVAVGGLLDGETSCPVAVTNRSGSTRSVTVTLVVRS